MPLKSTNTRNMTSTSSSTPYLNEKNEAPTPTITHESTIQIPEITITSPAASTEEDSANLSPLLVSKDIPNLKRSITGHFFHILYMIATIVFMLTFKVYSFIPVIITFIILLVPYKEGKLFGMTLSIGGESFMCRILHSVVSVLSIVSIFYFETKKYIFSIPLLLSLLLTSISALLSTKFDLARYMSLFYEKNEENEKTKGLLRSISGTAMWIISIVLYVFCFKNDKYKECFPGALFCFIMILPGVSSYPQTRFLLPIMNLILAMSLEYIDTQYLSNYMIIKALAIVGAISCSYLPICSRSAIWYSPIYKKISKNDRKNLKNDFGFTFKIESLFGVLSSLLVLFMIFALADEMTRDICCVVGILLLIPHIKNLFLVNYRAVRFFLCGREGMKLKRSVWGTIYSFIFTVLFAFISTEVVESSRQPFIPIICIILVSLIQNARVVIDQRIRGSIPIIVSSLMVIFGIMNYEKLSESYFYQPFLLSILFATLLLFPSYASLDSKWASWFYPLYSEEKTISEGDLESSL